MILFNQFVAKSIILRFSQAFKKMLGNKVKSIYFRIGPLLRVNISISNRCVSKKFKNTKHLITFQTITQSKLGCFQKRYTFCSYKLTELAVKIKELGEKNKIVEIKLLEKGLQKHHIHSKISQEAEKITQLKNKIKNSNPPSPEQVNELQQRQGALKLLKSKMDQTEKIIQVLEKDKNQLKKEEQSLIPKKEKQNSQSSNYWSKFGQIMAVIGGLATLYGLIVAYDQTYFGKWQFWDKTYGKEMQALRDFSTNNFDKDLQKYIDGSPIQKQMRSYIENPISINLFLAGCPGIGKSTSVKHLIKTYRQTNQFFYYINLKELGQSPQVKLEKLINLLNGIKRKHSETTKNKKSVKLIIDDVNSLQQLPQAQLTSIMNILSTYSDKDYLQVISISSSSGFISRLSSLKMHSKVQKVSQFTVLQDITGQKYSKFTSNLIQKYYGKVSDDVKNYIINREYSARDITLLKDQMSKKDQTDEQKLQFLKKKDQKQQQFIVRLCIKNVTKDKNPRLEQFFIQKLMKSPKQLHIQNCGKINDEIQKDFRRFNQILDFDQVIKKFEAQNLLIFCRPRNQTHRNGFERALNQSIEGNKHAKQI